MIVFRSVAWVLRILYMYISCEAEQRKRIYRILQGNEEIIFPPCRFVNHLGHDRKKELL